MGYVHRAFHILGRKVWVLGSKNQNADKSIPWGGRLPNLADPDVLIINLQSFNSDALKGIDRDTFFFARQTIFQRFIHGGIFIFITARHPEIPQRYLMDSPIYNVEYPIDYLCPFDMETRDVPVGYEILYNDKNFYSNYLENVRKYDFLISNIGTGKLSMYLGLIPSRLGPSIVRASPDPVNEITDKAGRILGGEFHANPHCRGTIVFLPPTTNITIEEGIDKILERFGKMKGGDTIPEWTKNIQLNGLNTINGIISQLETSKNNIVQQIAAQVAKRNRLMDNYRLLYDTDKPLEDAVRKAFIILGFGEIKRIRGEEYEDGIIDFNMLTDYKHAVLEVKGVNKGIAKEDIAQCEGWVTDYAKIGLNVKGIFVPNQWRLKPYRTSKNERESLEFNLLRYAENREICVIPSSILFEAVNQALAGKMKNRKDLERLIAHTNGIVHSI